MSHERSPVFRDKWQGSSDWENPKAPFVGKPVLNESGDVVARVDTAPEGEKPHLRDIVEETIQP
jgi:hypothetical protein